MKGQLSKPSRFYSEPLAFTVADWTNVLLDHSLTDDKLLILLTAMHSVPDHEAPASDLAQLVGYSHHAPLNALVSRFSKLIVAKYGIQPPLRADGSPRWWHIPFLGYDNKQGKFPWVLRPELSIALDELLGDKLPDHLFPEEVYSTPFYEGTVKSIRVNQYERNRHARRICIAHHGSKCCICGFDFRAAYGYVGYNKIHVHHLTRIADIGEAYEIDPIADLRRCAPIATSSFIPVIRRTQ